MDIGLEIISTKKDGERTKKKSMFIVFKEMYERDMVYNALHNVIPKSCITTE